MTRDEWVRAALDARVEQGFSVAIEDPAVLDFLADVLSRSGATTGGDRASAAGAA